MLDHEYQMATGHESTPGARAALDTLCRAYWHPLYCFVRRQGANPSAAEDLTQAFLAHLLERKALERVAPEKGRFRSFLLAALKFFLADAADQARAQKRGGGSTVVSLEEDAEEERYHRGLVDEMTAEMLYEQRWAMTRPARMVALGAREHR